MKEARVAERRGTLIAVALVAVFGFAAAASADYLEECQREGCSTEEVEELYESYEEECLSEGCSYEEIIELAGHPSSVGAMLRDFQSRGWTVDSKHLLAAECTPVGTTTKCTLVVMRCQDWYVCPDGTDVCPPDDPFCPGGNTKSSWYACGVCVGFDGC